MNNAWFLSQDGMLSPRWDPHVQPARDGATIPPGEFSFRWKPPFGQLFMFMSYTAPCGALCMSPVLQSDSSENWKAITNMISFARTSISPPSIQLLWAVPGNEDEMLFLRPPVPNLDSFSRMCTGSITWDPTHGIDNYVQTVLDAWRSNQWNADYTCYIEEDFMSTTMQFDLEGNTVFKDRVNTARLLIDLVTAIQDEFEEQDEDGETPDLTSSEAAEASLVQYRMFRDSQIANCWRLNQADSRTLCHPDEDITLLMAATALAATLTQEASNV